MSREIKKKPRHVRNWWLEGEIDGRRTWIGTGPVSETAGFSLKVFQRDRGNVLHALTLIGQPGPDGTLHLLIMSGDETIGEVVTER